MPADDRRPASQAPAHVRFVSLPLFCFLPFQRSGSTERNSSWLHAGAGSDTAGTLPRLLMCAQLLIDQAELPTGYSTVQCCTNNARAGCIKMSKA